ncbi:MAG: hypothetical protein AAB308_08175 [Nitrospirota bacterium]|mgnify:CR=1 FL=1
MSGAIRSRLSHLLIAAVIIESLAGCLPSLQVSQRAQADALLSRCRPPRDVTQLSGSLSVPRWAGAGIEVGIPVSLLSKEAQRTAALIGLLNLSEWSSIRPDGSQERHTLAMISLRQTVSHRMALVVSDVMATIAALDCEAARSDHLANAIAETHQDISDQALFAVLASDIFIGVIPGALMLSGLAIAAEANAVFGGVMAVGFGSVDTVLHIDQDFRHPYNVLRELWEGPSESQLFSPVVWKFLNDASDKDPDHTVREILLARWRTAGPGDKPELLPDVTGRLPLLLGEGGRYDQKALRLRAQMLQHLRSEVLRLGLSVHLLKYELIRWFDEQPLL